MKKLIFFGIWILVLLITKNGMAASPSEDASSTSKAQVMKIEAADEKKLPLTSPVELDRGLLQSTEPPPESDENAPATFFYSDTRLMSTYVGVVYSGAPGLTYGLSGVSYMFRSLNRFHLESAFDVIGSTEGHFRLMAKWYTKISEKWRPYYNLGMGVRVMSTDNLVVILSWSRYMVQGGGGIEWSFSQDWSVRAEAFAAADFNANTYMGIFSGVSIGF